MKLAWPYMSGGRLCSRVTPNTVPLDQYQIEYLINRLFDRCTLDVIVRGDGRIVLVARKIDTRSSRPREDK
jgi:hypothetical protein